MRGNCSYGAVRRTLEPGGPSEAKNAATQRRGYNFRTAGETPAATPSGIIELAAAPAGVGVPTRVVVVEGAAIEAAKGAVLASADFSGFRQRFFGAGSVLFARGHVVVFVGVHIG